ncbi:MAG: lipase family protein, partial [Thermoguttaceae bacterium]
ANCLTDLDTFLVSEPSYPGRVHSGFADAVDEVFPSVLSLLPASSGCKSLWITGHSLGGAMATLASVRLADAGYSIGGVYTYGSPRVGDRVFRDSYHWPNYRFVCGNDLVPHLPFRWCYKHVGRLRLLDDEGNLTGERKAWHAKKRSLAKHAKRIQRRHRRKIETHREDDDFDWLTDHFLERYLDAIGKIVPFVSLRKDLEEPNDWSHLVPTYVHRLDSASPGVPLPSSKHVHRRKHAVSEAELITAFCKQTIGHCATDGRGFANNQFSASLSQRERAKGITTARETSADA